METRSISKENVLDAQSQWGEGIVRIGADFIEKNDFTATAEIILKTYTLTISLRYYSSRQKLLKINLDQIKKALFLTS